MVSNGAVVVDIKLLYRNLWGCFEYNFDTPLNLVYSWPRLQSIDPAMHVTAFAACLNLLVFSKLLLPE
jgi:hypothetical protein